MADSDQNCEPEIMTERTAVKLTCETHGEYDGSVQVMFGKEFKSACPICAEERRNKNRDFERRQEQARKEAKIRAALQRSGIPKRYIGNSLDSYATTKPGQSQALAIARAYAENFAETLDAGRCLIFTGTTGTGKTHLATAIANRAIQQGHTAIFASVREIVGAVKNTWRKGVDKTEQEAMEPYVACDLLVIDEVGVQFDTDAERLIMFDVINRRYENVRPMILISNLPIDAQSGEPSVRSVLGDRVLDRLRENGGKLVKFNWESHRGAA